MRFLNVEDAIDDLKSGKPVLIFDFPDRENETDMVFYAGYVDEESVYKLRVEAGGLICYATNMKISKQINLPILSDILGKYRNYRSLINKNPLYGSASALSLWVNHINTKTGISDKDRALTINRLHQVIELACANRQAIAKKKFFNEFYFPGHVPILISKDLSNRQGHTELSIGLALAADLYPSVVFAEILDKGVSTSLLKAEEYAKDNSLSLVKGKEIIEYMRKMKLNV